MTTKIRVAHLTLDKITRITPILRGLWMVTLPLWVAQEIRL
jgi:hypothetical protein